MIKEVEVVEERRFTVVKDRFVFPPSLPSCVQHLLFEIGVKRRHVVKRGCNSNSPNGVNCFMWLLRTHVVSNTTG